MLHLECIDTTNSNTLVEGNLYYGFPTGGGALYVSRFPSEGSHMGAYQRSRFNILTEEDFIAKKEALASKLFKQEIALEKEVIIKEIIEADQIIEGVVEEASIELGETSDVKKRTSDMENGQKVEVIKESVTMGNDEEIVASEIPLVEDVQEQIVETKLQKSTVVQLNKESEENQYKQLSIFDI
ncbi:hypothetical protein ABD91_21265 [Lysinibacillus sphaericus]|uniref:hypothetical protein n=1 Tax=Lysinibacillus sphaericus TaxID=1421 RepID=UPI0018CEF235|nr:hypothetical protein [Lysinibacillus sphaericus]MBG9693269.1 hypothetical protein [Lysinibacillus sphaericus]